VKNTEMTARGNVNGRHGAAGIKIKNITRNCELNM
jgi:hypothetical protein